MAKRAAAKRWSGVAHAEKTNHIGAFRIGDKEIPCAVLVRDGKEIRLVSERALVKSFGGKRGGSHWLRMKQDPNGAKLPAILSAGNLKPFISDDLIAALNDRVLFSGPGMRSPAYGLRAELYPQICEVYLSARDNNELRGKGQRDIAAAADILMRALAHTGIAALVDEATGYQRVRDDRALEAILNRYIGAELAKWAKRFPNDFYQQMCRLRGLRYDPESSKRPYILARITIDVVYDRIGPGLTDELKKRKAQEIASGGKDHKLHQWLTEEIGHPSLAHHLSGVVFLSRGFHDGDWDGFHHALDRIAPPYNRTMLLDFPDDNLGIQN